MKSMSKKSAPKKNQAKKPKLKVVRNEEGCAWVKIKSPADREALGVYLFNFVKQDDTAGRFFEKFKKQNTQKHLTMEDFESALYLLIAEIVERATKYGKYRQDLIRFSIFKYYPKKLLSMIGKLGVARRKDERIGNHISIDALEFAEESAGRLQSVMEEMAYHGGSSETYAPEDAYIAKQEMLALEDFLKAYQEKQNSRFEDLSKTPMKKRNKVYDLFLAMRSSPRLHLAQSDLGMSDHEYKWQKNELEEQIRIYQQTRLAEAA